MYKYIVAEKGIEVALDSYNSSKNSAQFIKLLLDGMDKYSTNQVISIDDVENTIKEKTFGYISKDKVISIFLDCIDKYSDINDMIKVFPNVQTYGNNPRICPWYFCGTCWDDKYSGKGSNLDKLLYKNQVIDIFLNCAKDCNSIEELKNKFTSSVMDYNMFGRCE